jgi:solute carrier family 25 carnitine/acylcarnitine transporter 20/29
MQRDLVNRKTFIKSVQECYKNEGFAGFFKGVSFPVISVPIVNAVLFSVHNLSKSLLGFNEENEMSIYEGMLCGAIAGLTNCLVATPIELVKCKLQVQYESISKAYYKGVIDCVRKIYLQGGIKAIYQGNYAMIWREIPGYAAQFAGYDYSKKIIAKFMNKSIDSLNSLELMICGAVGGYLCWQFSYPQDVIKTLLQTQSTNKELETTNNRNYYNGDQNNVTKFRPRFYDGGFYECAKYIYQSEGMIGFWRGYLPCTLRAFLANGVLFLTYEKSKYYLSTLYKKKNKGD